MSLCSRDCSLPPLHISHFLFVPLTLGLSILLAIMETRYVQDPAKRNTGPWRNSGEVFSSTSLSASSPGSRSNFSSGPTCRCTPLCGGHIRAAPRHRGDGRLLSRIDLHRCLGFRVGTSFPPAHSVTIWLVAVAANLSSRLGPDRERMDAAPGGLHDERGSARAVRPRRRHHAGLRPAHHTPHARGRRCHRLLRDGGERLPSTANAVPPIPFTRSFRMGLSMALIFGFFVVTTGSSLRDVPVPAFSTPPSSPLWNRTGRRAITRPSTSSRFPILQERRTASRSVAFPEPSACSPFILPGQRSPAFGTYRGQDRPPRPGHLPLLPVDDRPRQPAAPSRDRGVA